jgi:YD repeat-containing protein
MAGKATQRDIIRRYWDLAGTQLIAETDYTFDDNGRVTDLDHRNSSGTIAAYDYDYDISNRIIEFASPEGVTIYNYDRTDQLIDADHSYQGDEDYSYDDNGNRTNAGYSTGENNQLDSDGVYNYQYDNEGNLIEQTEIATGIVTQYEWDYRNRLIDVIAIDSNGNAVGNSDYTYDVNDSRIAKCSDPE